MTIGKFFRELSFREPFSHRVVNVTYGPAVSVATHIASPEEENDDQPWRGRTTEYDKYVWVMKECFRSPIEIYVTTTPPRFEMGAPTFTQKFGLSGTISVDNYQKPNDATQQPSPVHTDSRWPQDFITYKHEVVSEIFVYLISGRERDHTKRFIFECRR